MQSLLRLFYPLQGRLLRSQFWMAAVICAILSIVVALVFYGLGIRSEVTVAGLVEVDGKLQPFTHTQLILPGWASVIVGVAWAAPLTLASIKRRHDRDFPGWDVLALFVLWGLYAIVIAGGMRNEWTSAMAIVLWVWAAILVLYLGFFKGTAGPNAYGPDPLARNDPHISNPTVLDSQDNPP